MSDELNPYASPSMSNESPFVGELTFGGVIKRGFWAAHRAPAGGIWMFVLIAPMQVIGAVMNSLMFQGDLFEKLQNPDAGGGAPPPEIFVMMGVGCFACVWMPMMLFAVPWIWGGTAGQLHERITNQKPGAFTAYAKRFYVTILLVVLVLLAVVIAIGIVNGIVNQIVSMSVITPGEPMTTDQLRALTTHPINVISSILTGLLTTAAGTGITIAAWAAVARGRGIADALGQAFSFCGRNLGEVFLLFVLFVLLMLPFSIIQWVIPFTAPTMVVGAIVGVASGLYLGYLTVVNFGLAGSLFEARQLEKPLDGAGEPEPH